MFKSFASRSTYASFQLSGLCASACIGVLAACASSETIDDQGMGGMTSSMGGSAATAGQSGNANGGAGNGGTVSGVGGASSGGVSSNGTGGRSAGGMTTAGGGSSSTGGAGAGGTTAMGGTASSGGSTSTGGASGASGSNSGGANTGGGKATGGTASGGSSGSGGNATGGSGSGGKATGGSGSGGKATGGSGSGGKATGGAAGNGGSGGCGDGDKDGLTDCDETSDGSDWTDPAVFNGLHVERGNQCSGVGSCNENDTQQEVNACMQNNVDEQRDQHAGWDWEDPPDNICDSGYGFSPNWTGCDVSWAARWTGCIHLDTAGPHCFQITGGTDEGCAALYFNGNTGNADAQTGTAVKCFSVAAGNYPLMFHYTMDEASHSSMHVRYCDAQGGSTCTPTVAIPSRMLRTSCQ